VPLASGAVAVIIVAVTANGVVATNWNDANGDPTGIAIYTPAPTPSDSVASPTRLPTFAQTPGPSATVSPTDFPIGGPGWTIGVVGDSVMVSAMPGLQAEAAKRGWRLIAAAKRSCPIGYETLYDQGGAPSPNDGQCGIVRTLHDQLLAAKPNVVIWHDLQSALARKSPSGALLNPGTTAWKLSLFEEWSLVLDRFLAVGAKVVIVLPPLRSQQAPGCQGVANQARCQVIQRQDTVIRQATQEWFAGILGQKGVYEIQVDSLLCPHGNPCPGKVAGIDVRLPGYDQTHFTQAGSTWFAPRLFDKVVAALEGPAPSPAPTT
jgi:hypothetical protein